MIINDEIYQKNISVLEKKYTNIIEKLNKIKDDITVLVGESKDKNKYMMIRKNNMEMFVHSRYRPLDEALRWYQSLDIAEESTIMIFGFGLGYHIFELLRNINTYAHLIIYEPEAAVFKEAIKFIDIEEIIKNENITLVISDEDELKRTLLDNITWITVNLFTYGCLTNYEKLFDREYKNILEIIKTSIVVKAIGRNTVFGFAYEWQKNTLKNLPYALKSNHIKQFFGLFNDKPCIIVAAGPSLNKNFKLLKEAKDKAVIICVGRALKVLLKENIIPDLVVTIDAGEISFEQFRDINFDHIPLVYTPKAYYGIMKKHVGNKIVMSVEDYYFDIIFSKLGYDIGTINSGGSVACTAFDIAVKFGCNPLIFIGLDLANSKERTHAEGAEFSNNPQGIRRREHIMVKDIYGDDIYTDDALYSFLVWFETVIAADKSGRVYIDATEGGAKIEGSQVLTFAETLQKYCTENIYINKKILKVIAETPKISETSIQEIQQDFKKLLEQLIEIRKYSEEGKKLSNKLHGIFKNRYNSRVDKILLRLDEIDTLIKSKNETFIFINFIVQPVIFNVYNSLNEQKDESEMESNLRIALKSKMLYSGIENAMKQTIPLLEQCIKDLDGLLADK